MCDIFSCKPQLCCVIKLRNKVALQNCRCDINLSIFEGKIAVSYIENTHNYMTNLDSSCTIAYFFVIYNYFCCNFTAKRKRDVTTIIQHKFITQSYFLLPAVDITSSTIWSITLPTDKAVATFW